VTVRYRPDGRPEVDGGWAVSASHGAGVTLAMAAPHATGCDIEAVIDRERDAWSGLLGRHLSLADLIASEAGESLSVAATRIWSALEALQKAGQLPATPITPAAYGPGRWVLLGAGPWRVATFVTMLRGVPEPVAVAVVTHG
jgi:enediyne polyketide synthase